MAYTTPFISSQFTSSLRRGLDLPVWEWLRFNPIGNTAAGWCTCTSENGMDRFIYFLSTTAAPNAFYRYDTWTDGWQTLASPNTALLTVGSMKYTSNNGFRCRALQGITNTTTTINMPALTGQVLAGNIIRILEGTGKGQTNTILSVSDPIIQDSGVVTTATASQLTDTTKKWKYNQWAGYQVRLTYAAGSAQLRTILYNDNQNLYLSDTNYQAIDSWNNTGFSSQTPFAIPVSTAGSQTYYVIESSTVALANPWNIPTDQTSKIVVYSGGIWLMTSLAAGALFAYQYYDIAEDSWTTKTTNQNILLTALAGDISIRNFDEVVVFGVGQCGNPTASLFYPSFPSASIFDPANTGSAIWPSDKFTNYQCRIVSGSGVGQRRRIIAMTGSSLQVIPNFNPPIDTSSVYAIYGDTDKIYSTVGNNTTLFQYHVENDVWATGDISYAGIFRNMGLQWYGSSSYESVGMTSITKYSGSIFSMSVAVGGSGYNIGDTFLLGGGGVFNFGAKGRVTAVGLSASISSSVLGVEVFSVGNGYISGSFLSSSNFGGAVGTGFTASVVSSGSCGRITTAINHWFQRGDTCIVQGTTDNLWNNTSSVVLGADSLTTLDITGSTLAGASSSFASFASSLTDSSANWAPNELVGKIIQKSLVGASSTTEMRKITANTATSASISTPWTVNPINGTGRYVIYEARGFGRDEQYKTPSTSNRGYATTGSNLNPSCSVLIDTTKNWAYNQWTGSIIRFVAGSGSNNECTVLTNNSQSITLYSSSFGGTVGNLIFPDSSSKYIIQDSYGLATGNTATTTLGDTTKNWTVNQWAGKQMRFVSGTNVSQEIKITSNTSNILTFPISSAPSTDTCYVIYGSSVKGSGHTMVWNWGATNNPGRYLYIPVGGGGTRFDRYDITTQLWDYGIFIQPISETLSTGTMYAYDSSNRIYFTTNATGRVFYLDLTSNKVYPYGITPYAQGAAAVGNRMEVVTTPDGLQFLIIFRHTGQEIWRSLIVV